MYNKAAKNAVISTYVCMQLRTQGSYLKPITNLLSNLNGIAHAVECRATHGKGRFSELLLEFLTLLHYLTDSVGVTEEHHLGVGRFAGELAALGEFLLHPSLDTALMFEDGLVGDGAAGTADSYEIVMRTSELKVPLEYFLPLLGVDGNVTKAVDVRSKASIVAVGLEVLTKEKFLEKPTSLELILFGHVEALGIIAEFPMVASNQQAGWFVVEDGVIGRRRHIPAEGSECRKDLLETVGLDDRFWALMTARLAGRLVGISVQLIEQDAIDLEVVTRSKVLEELMDVMFGGGVVGQHPAIRIVLLETLAVGRARNLGRADPDLEWSGEGVVPILHVNVMSAAVAEESDGLEAGLILEIFHALDRSIVAKAKDEQSIISG